MVAEIMNLVDIEFVDLNKLFYVRNKRVRDDSRFVLEKMGER